MKATSNAVAVYDTHEGAEAAVMELKKSGFDIRNLSIVGRDYHTEEQVVGYYNAGDRMKYWGKLGAFWGSLFGLLLGWAFFWVPGIGPLLVAGPLAGWILDALEGAAVVGGLSALGAGLYGLGIPKDTVLRYETAIKAGKYLLLVHGADDQVERARSILRLTRPSEVFHHTGHRPGEIVEGA